MALRAGHCGRVSGNLGNSVRSRNAAVALEADEVLGNILSYLYRRGREEHIA